jgi:DNA-binding MarR family transcriptional regulator
MENVRKLTRAVSILRMQDPNMPMSVVLTFLLVAGHREPEIEVRELHEKSGLTQSALNRAITQLGESHWSRTSSKGGLGLVEQTISPEDRRVRIARLTQKGRSVLKALEGALE